MTQRYPTVLGLIATSAFALAIGCTSDATRLEPKAAAYRAAALDDEKRSLSATTKAEEVQWLRRSIQRTEKEIGAIKRISPSSYPDRRDGTITAEAAQARKDESLVAAQARLEGYRQRLGAINED